MMTANKMEWRILQDYPMYEMNADGKVRKIDTKKYLPVLKDALGRELVVFHNANKYHYSIAEYIADLKAMTYEPEVGQTAIVKTPERVAKMPEPEVVVKPRNKRCRRIRCIETGEVFKSYTACANHFGFPYDKFYDTFKATGRFGDYTFEDVTE